MIVPLGVLLNSSSVFEVESKDLCRLFAVAWDLGPQISIKRSVTVLKHLQWLCDGDIGVCVYVCMCVFV